MPHWLLTGVCWFLAAELLLFAPLKFYPRGIRSWPSYPVKFKAWGFPPWFSFVTGAGEIFAGVTLILPSRRFLGAVVMIVILVGAMVTHQINHDRLSDSISAPIHFVLVVLVALSTWPTDWTQPLTVGERQPQCPVATTVWPAGGDAGATTSWWPSSACRVR
jgi:uncharacterized membrane protein YphA (DoxX/SURF4 family)